MSLFFGELPPFSLIRDFRKENTRGNVSKISVNHACYRGQKVTLVAVIGGFRSDLSITCMIDDKFWKRFRGCFVFESRVSTKTVVNISVHVK